MSKRLNLTKADLARLSPPAREQIEAQLKLLSPEVRAEIMQEQEEIRQKYPRMVIEEELVRWRLPMAKDPWYRHVPQSMVIVPLLIVLLVTIWVIL